MRARYFQVLLEWDREEEVWVTTVPALDYLSTFGETREGALGNTHEAILGYIEASEKEGLPLPSDQGSAELVDLEVPVV